MWLGALVLGTSVAGGCAATASKPAAQPRPGFGQGLHLDMSLGRALVVGDRSVAANFTLTNEGSAAFDGCFGPEWGVNLILQGGRDAGHLEIVDHPGCIKRFSLSPGERIEWSQTVALADLRAGEAKVNGWLKVVDPRACDQKFGCYDASVTSRLMTITIGER
jgi:hypothetical protein